MVWYQQGDVLIKPADEIPDGASVMKDTILAWGESTGHKHQVFGEGVQLYMFQGQIYLHALGTVKVTHVEHETLDIPAGIYYIEIVREYNHFAEEARQVTD